MELMGGVILEGIVGGSLVGRVLLVLISKYLSSKLDNEELISRCEFKYANIVEL